MSIAGKSIDVPEKTLVYLSKEVKDLSKYGTLILSNLITEGSVSEEVRNSKGFEALGK